MHLVKKTTSVWGLGLEEAMMETTTSNRKKEEEEEEEEEIWRW